MDWKRIDQARRAGGPIEADLIEAYAKGKINRRNFVKRGAIVGLSAPLMGAVIAACGSDDDEGDEPASTEASGGDEPASTEAPAGTDAPASGGATGGEIIAGIQTGDANSGLDPVNMLDLGTYAVNSQAFEYLVGLGADGNIDATALAESWTPNDDATAWTFNLRQGAEWSGGEGMFTSADVAASIDRMISVGAIPTPITEGSVETPDEFTAVVNLDSPNGNLPVLLSLFNPQTLITPADYENGTVLNDRPTGTGAWMLDDFDPSGFRARFVPNPNWWGGSVSLDSVVLQGFDTAGTKVAAIAAGEIDVIQDFTVTDGANLLEDPNIVTIRPPSANHRQLWFNTQDPNGGAFTNPLVRQAVGYAINRQQIVDTIYEGEAIIANDHPVYPTLPFFDDSQEQRPYDPEMAMSLLAEAGFEGGVEDTLQVGEIGEVPQLAAIVQANLAEVGINTQLGLTPNSDFYGEFWCPAGDTAAPGYPCGNSATIGIVDYGHRPTPDIYFGRALATDGDWNSSNYASDDFDALFAQYQSAVDVAGQQDAVGQIQRLLHEDMPAVYHTFFNYLVGHSSAVAGLQTTSLGHLLLQETTKS